MALDQAFIDDCPYGPDALLIDDIVEIDRDAVIVRDAMAEPHELGLEDRDDLGRDGAALGRLERVHWLILSLLRTA